MHTEEIVLAQVIERSEGRITFEVDDVSQAEPRGADWRLIEGQEVFEARLGNRPMWASSVESGKYIDAGDTHPLFAAVHYAFGKHCPLILGPDVIWLTIARGFALHVNNNAEAMRRRFVKHDHRKSLVVRAFAFPDDVVAWTRAVEGWSTLLADELGEGMRRLMECDFTTTTPADRVASQIVMMDTFKKYFDYILAGICGIPQVTLEGAPEDWRQIRARVEVLSEFDLSWWTDRLLPICDALIETACGRPPLVFWQNIYKPRGVYGGDVCTGWLADLFPYLKGGGYERYARRNPILGKRRVLHQLTVVISLSDPDPEPPPMSLKERLLAKHKPERMPPPPPPRYEEDTIMVEDGITSGEVPKGLSEVRIKTEGFEWMDNAPMSVSLVGGVTEIRYDPKTYEISPRCGWGVFQVPPEVLVLDRIEREHVFRPVEQDVESEIFWQRPKLWGHMLDHYGGVPVIYADLPWRTHLRAPHALTRFNEGQENGYRWDAPDNKLRDLTLIADLADGRVVVYGAENADHMRVFVARLVGDEAHYVQQLHLGFYEEDGNESPYLIDVRPIATTLEDFLTRTLDSPDGYYFDGSD